MERGQGEETGAGQLEGSPSQLKDQAGDPYLGDELSDLEVPARD